MAGITLSLGKPEVILGRKKTNLCIFPESLNSDWTVWVFCSIFLKHNIILSFFFPSPPFYIIESLLRQYSCIIFSSQIKSLSKPSSFCLQISWVMHNRRLQHLSKPTYRLTKILLEKFSILIFMFPNRGPISFGSLQDLIVWVGDFYDLFIDAEGFN